LSNRGDFSWEPGFGLRARALTPHRAAHNKRGKAHNEPAIAHSKRTTNRPTRTTNRPTRTTNVQKRTTNRPTRTANGRSLHTNLRKDPRTQAGQSARLGNSDLRGELRVELVERSIDCPRSSMTAEGVTGSF